MYKTIAIAAVLVAVALTGIFSSTPMAAYAEGDYSGTHTEQEIKQKNVGSGDSTNNNCALNSIHTAEDATVSCPIRAEQTPPPQ